MSEHVLPSTGSLPSVVASRLHQLCSRFEAALAGEEAPLIEDFLADPPEPGRAVLLRELLGLELAFRTRLGERPAPEDYQARFPEHAGLIAAAFSAAESVREQRDTWPPAPVGDVALPAQLGRYRLTAKLGAGAFGIVYRGYDDDLRRDVAIKVPHRERLAAAEGAEAYLAEARVLARLDHPGIVPVYDFGRTDDGFCYLVSKLVEGSDLAEWLDRGKPSPAEAAEIVARVAEALHHAHQHGLVHRDIKPANLLLDAQGNPVVADFGLALRDEDFGTGPTFAGTPAYMSPEQARGEGHRVDARTDVYSLGAVFYQLLTGRRPFDGAGTEALLEQIKSQEPRPPRQADDAVPRELDRICLKALSKRAADRYSTARDLADDLRHWQAGDKNPAAVQVQVVLPPGMGAVTSLPTPMSAVADTDRRPVKVIPKGLRSFDAADADFFLELLPGPRDRDGLPESLRFWKSRIEQMDTDQTFPVGLIYGPSGCGKSSLVKAGLLPRLESHVRAVYVEATAEDTEARLLKGLRKHCPELPPGLGVADALAAMRRGHGLPAGHKVLLVLDQFEQWLHAKRRQENTDLVQALRQCDGGRVQCVVMVRDDFWMAATRFLHDLEVPLVEGQNSAAVDLFDLRHARKVLTAFGRSLGALPEAPAALPAEQERFVEQAVEGLSEDGKVISVRLALFAEMVKGKRWTPATLRAVGGAAGVGVAFLEETFSAATAPPAHRYHQQAARAILKALLPEQGTDIKGNMRSREELQRLSSYADRPRDFDQLLRILDSELRLVTPTEAASGGRQPPAATPADDKTPHQGADAPRSPGDVDDQYYQLTHDYLVPSLRDWLTRKQKETRRGRAELRLAERTVLWQAKPESRHLPAWWEWLNIRLLSRPRDWTPAQRKLMRRASRFHGLRLAALLVFLALLGWGGWETFGRLEARALRDRLLNADTGDVPAIVADMAPYRGWTGPLLRQAYAEAEANHDARRQLHASLALLPDDPGQVEYLYGRLLGAAPHEVTVLHKALRPHQEELRDRLWAVVEQPPRGQEGQRLRAGAALAAYDPEDPRWDNAVEPVVRQLVAENPAYLGPWLDGFRPVKGRLLAPLAEVFRDRKEGRSAERSLATSILADYAAERPSVLAGLLVDADEKQFAVLFPKLREHAEVAGLLRKELGREARPDWKDAPLDPAWETPAAALRQEIEQADGILADRFALCQTLPLERFTALAEALRRCGYRPVRLRPYAVATGGPLASSPQPTSGPLVATRVAAVWTRDGREWQLALGQSAKAIRGRDADCRKQGYRPEDVAGYLVKEEAGTAERFAALWARPATADDAAELYVGVPDDRHKPDGWGPLKDKGLMPRTYQAFRLADGQRHFSAVWGKTASNPAYQDTFGSDESDYVTMATADKVGIDVSLYAAAPVQNTGQRFREQLAQAELTLRSKPRDLQALYQAGVARYRLALDQQALTALDALVAGATNPAYVAGHQFRALVHARLGNTEEALRDLATFRQRNTQAGLNLALPAIVAAYLGQDVDGMARLAEAVAANATDGQVLYNAAEATAQAAHIVRTSQTERLRAVGVCAGGLLGLPAVPLPVAWLEQQQKDRADTYAERAVALLRQAVARGYADYSTLQTDPNFDPIRQHPSFVDILGRGHLERQYAAVWQGSAVRESTEAHGLAPANHLTRCRELSAAGYRPVALSVAALAEGTPPVTASVWQRPMVAEAERTALAKQQAVAAAGLLRLGQAEPVWPLFQHTPDPERRSYLIAQAAALGVEAPQLVRRLEEETNVSARRALILSLGEYGPEQFPPEVRGPLVEKLLRWYQEDPDPGIHGAIDWLLRHAKEGPEPRKLDWGQAVTLRKIDDSLRRRDPDGVRRWYVNGHGQTMVLMPAPEPFRMGSPGSEIGHRSDETPHTRRIGRNFAFADKAVTVGQFEQFVRERPDVTQPTTNEYSPDPAGPIIGVSWYMAAQYCNWLSDKEGLDESEWCYPKHAGIKEGMKPVPGYLKGKGYRLPTEAEWEYAARAGGASSRSYGSCLELLPRDAWYMQNAQNRAWPVGQKRPNDLGLFDMHGNVLTWCQTGYDAYPVSGERTIDDKEDIKSLIDTTYRVLRGGSFLNPPVYARSACRYFDRPSNRSNSVGLRLARTYD